MSSLCMKILNTKFNRNNQPSFNGGLSKKLSSEILNTNVANVSQRLLKFNIVTDFNNNKTVAWCCQKVVELINELNQKYKLNLSLPKGIFVENFDNLNIGDKTLYAFCNMQPTKLLKNSDTFVPSRILFFNSFNSDFFLKNNMFFNWNNIDEIADLKFANKTAPTDYFLDIFFHEFAHVIHENHLINTLGSEIVAQKLQQIGFLQKSGVYKERYGEELSKICDYATINPLEAISCDLSRILSNEIDKNKLMYNTNPLKLSPYNNYYCELFNTKLNNILRKFWKGEFE